jgi:hypothetical protein
MEEERVSGCCSRERRWTKSMEADDAGGESGGGRAWK